MKSLLSPVLSAQQCASCRFCCTFLRSEAWETPVFSEKELLTLSASYGPLSVLRRDGAFTYDLSAYWLRHGPDSYAPCPFLDKDRGCMRDEAHKPFDCKIWPLRVMRMESGSVVIVLDTACRVLDASHTEQMKDFVVGSAAEEIAREAFRNPSMIKDYSGGLPVLLDITHLMKTHPQS